MKKALREMQTLRAVCSN